jgi:hypothetical protein
MTASSVDGNALRFRDEPSIGGFSQNASSDFVDQPSWQTIGESTVE